jgi:hypothetical protein
MEIPPFLISEINNGNAVLMLGAGASREAVAPSGQHPPMGAKLAEMLSDKFLGGEFRTSPLNVVSRYAMSESSLLRVQEYIRTLFEPFAPTESHKTLATFCW